MNHIIYLAFWMTCSFVINAQTMTANCRTFDDITYTIQYPADWDLDTSGKNGTSFLLLTQNHAPGDPFRENINLLINKLASEDITLDVFAKASEAQIGKAFENAKLLTSTRVRSAHDEHHRVIYLGTRNGYELKFRQRYWVHEGHAYVLTFSGLAANWDQYEEVSAAIFDTFAIKK